MEEFLQLVYKPLFIFAVFYLYFRIAGKKAVLEMTSFDLLFVILMGSLAAYPLISSSLWQTALYGAVLSLVYVAYAWSARIPRIRKWLLPRPATLVRNGEIDEKQLRRERLTVSDLMSKIREKGYTHPKQLALVALEHSGKFSIIPNSDQRTVTTSDLNLTAAPAYIPIPLILEGKVVEENLFYLDKDWSWLRLQLAAYGLSIDQDLQRVTLATYHPQGYLEIDLDYPRQKGQGSYQYTPEQHS